MTITELAAERRRIMDRLLCAEFGTRSGPHTEEPGSKPDNWQAVLGEHIDPAILKVAGTLRKGQPCKPAVPFRSIFD